MMRKTSIIQRPRLSQIDIMSQDRINLPVLLMNLEKQNLLKESTMLLLIKRCKHILNNQPNLLMIQDPVLVVGDIHGQFFDFLQIIKYSKVLQPNFKDSDWKVLFLGDYVDRGVNSMQVMTFIISLKIQYPNNVFLLRGNHQSMIMTQQYNFKQECCQKYPQNVYDEMLELFNLLPIACVVNDTFFCVHGGISDKLMHIKDMNKMNRKIQIPLQNSAFCDFIWSDPVENIRGHMNKRCLPNPTRQCSILYGAALTKQFLQDNQLSTIIRGHQVFLQGYRQYNWNSSSDIPSIITVFSAPNYCGSSKNLAAVLFIEKNNVRIKQFKEQQPQRYRFLAKFDVFSWTIPEILVNVNQILKEMMETIINLKIPELQNESLQKKIYIFIRYAVQNKLKLFDNQAEKGQLVVPTRQFKTEQEQRNYYFTRSHDYYSALQKVPKH